jgi:hypothetical protein
MNPKKYKIKCVFPFDFNNSFISKKGELSYNVLFFVISTFGVFCFFDKSIKEK